MRSYVPAYDLRVPANLTEALAWMERELGVWRPFAGGTDLMVLLEAGKLKHTRYLNLTTLQELKGIRVWPHLVTLGAMTTYSELQAHPVLRQDFPLLCQAARETGSIATQNRGTLGGNIANASPAADSPPALLVYDAELELISARGSRRVPYRLFHTGYKQMDLAADELIRAIHLPRRTTAWRQYFRKVGPRRAQAISKVCFAGVASVKGGVIRDVRIALGSVAPIPLRCERTESQLNGLPVNPSTIRAARAVLDQEIAPIDDIRSTERYRRLVAGNLLEEFLSPFL
jgi:CO/xanthine dehydrogenase FAD-binding subunit